jgi:surfeit locus 1 family protein
MREYSRVTNGRRLRFAPRPFATLLTVVAVFAFASLGLWQLSRAAEKRAVAEDFSSNGSALALPADSRGLPRYQRVSARGRYDPDRQFLIDNRIHEGRAGVMVLTPFALENGGRVLVNRGWLPFGATREELPDIAVDAGVRNIVGRLDELPRPGILLSSPPAATWPRLVNYPTMDELATALGQPLHSRVILLDAGVPDGYVRAWKLPGATPDRNLGYAIQWFAFAATAVAIWLAVSLRRPGEEA